MTKILLRDARFYSCKSLLVMMIAGGLAWSTGGLSPALAKQGGYAPPGGVQSLDSLMDGSSGSNGYDLDALVVEGQKNGVTPSSSPVSGRSVIEDMTAPQSPEATVRKALRAENRKLKTRISSLTVQLNSQQKKLDEALTKLNVGDGVAEEQVTQLTTTLKAQKAQGAALENQLSRMKLQVADMKSQLAKASETKDQLETTLASVREQLKSASAKAAGTLTVPLDTSARKQAYVVGQAMAASMRERLNNYENAGVKLDRARIIAGLSDGLRDRMTMKRKDMDTAWQTFAAGLQQHIQEKVKASEALLTKLIANRKPAITADGMQFFVVKKGKTVKDKNALRSLSLIEQLAPDGKVVSQVPHLTLSPDDEMPAVVRDAFPLLGPGGEVEVFALARTVYGNRPLPKGVVPYTVLRYRMTGLATR